MENVMMMMTLLTLITFLMLIVFTNKLNTVNNVKMYWNFVKMSHENTASLFHFQLKTCIFNKSFPP